MTKAAQYAKIASSILILAAAFSAIVPAPVSAQTVSCSCGNGQSAFATTEQGCAQACGALTGGAQAGGTTGTGAQTAGTLQNPIAICGSASGQKCVQLIIGNVIRAALGIVGSIALLMMIYGGFMWLTSMGNSEKVEKGKATLIWAVLGLVVIFGAYALTEFILKTIAGGGK